MITIGRNAHINKALIEIPPKFAGRPPVNPESHREANLRTWKRAEGLAEDVRYYGKWMRDEAWKRIGHLYPEVKLPKEHGGGKATVIAWLWARTVASPNPACGGAQVPLVSSLWLSKKPGKEVWVDPIVDRTNNTWRFEVQYGKPAVLDRVNNGTKAGKAQDFICVLSGAPVPRDYIRAEGKANRLGERLMAVVADGKAGRVYLSPVVDEQAGHLAEHYPSVTEARGTFLAGPTPTRAMITGGVCSAYGLSTWGHLFTDRQLATLTLFSALVGEARAKVLADAREAGMRPGESLEEGGVEARSYSDAIAVYLGTVVSKLTVFLNVNARWRAGEGKSAPAFGRQALPMVWDFAEVNPFAGAGGDFDGVVDGARRVLLTVPAAPAGEVAQAPASAPPSRSTRACLCSTDPPYYDNISYAEISDFFYLWLRRSLYEVLPNLFRTILVPKAEELVAIPFRFGGDRTKAREFFEAGLREAFDELGRRHKDGSLVTVYYAFKQAETDAEDEGSGDATGAPAFASTGWETMLSGLLDAGFGITGTWPSRTEGGTRLIARGTNSLASSIVLVCRKRPDDAPTITRADFRRLLRQELPPALRNMQQGNIAPVDMAQASIGPGMAIFSRHAKVLEANGSPMPVRTALQLINQALDEYLAEQEGEFDADTRFAVTWFETHAFDTGPYGEAETLAKARNVSVAGVVEAGVLSSVAGKVRLLRREELPDDWDPGTDQRLTIWEATQHLIKRLDQKGEQGGATLLGRLGATAAAARDLAYRLFTTCERKGWAEEARAYNGLVVAWPELEKLAVQPGIRTPVQQSLI